MDPTIKKILKLNRVEGIFHTHVSLIQPKGKFQFNRQTLEEFWNAYCNYIEKGSAENIDCIVGIAEKPQQYLPILVDVDLCIRDNEEKIETDTLYSDEQLKFIVETYQSVLRKIVDNCSDEDLMCIVLEKDMYQITKNEITYFKNGFHLHFPNIFLNKIDQETQVIPRVKDSIKEAKLFNNLGIEDSSSVIDSQCCKVPWLLYGSRKEGEYHKPYKVSKVYDSNLNIISLEKAFKKYQIFDDRERLIDLKGKVLHYLPRILSIVPYGRGIKEVKQGTISPIKEKLKKERKSSAQHNKLCLEDTLKVIKRLLPMLSEFRASERNEWMNIGWIIYNETEGHPDGLDLWCEFSSRCEDKYDENVCIHTWERMTKGDLTLGTLRHYASIDNPNEYKKFKDEQCARHVANSLEGSHNDVAKALFAEYGDQFVCSSFSGKVWYQFKGHIWEQIDSGVFLREKISGNFVLKYYDAVKNIYEELKENHANQDKSKDAICNAKIKQIQKIIQSMKNSSYKNSVMSECICEGSLVSLSSGLSMKIENMDKHNKVLSWDKSLNGLTVENQINFIPKGEKECIKITFLDGTYITCTPDHKVLQSGNWVEARTLKTGDLLHNTIKGPEYSYKSSDPIWELNAGIYKFSNKTEEDWLKSLSFSRILGFLLTDGSISESKINVHARVAIGLQMDINAYVDDIELITGIKPKIRISENRKGFVKNIMYNVTLPNKLTRAILSLPGVPVGRRSLQGKHVPDFLMAPECPLDIVREFIAGMWGGDGRAPTFDMKRNIMRSTGFSKSKIHSEEEGLTDMMESVKYLLSRLGITDVSYRTSKKFTVKDQKFIEKTLTVGMSDYIKFTDNIGFRYCTEKALKLYSFSCYRRAIEYTRLQYGRLVHKIKKEVDYEAGKRKGVKAVMNRVYEQFLKEEIVLFPEAIRPRYGSLTSHIRNGTDNITLERKFPQAREFLESIEVLDYFTPHKYVISQQKEYVPSWRLPIVDIRSVGVSKVYDLTVLNNSSFVANGVVVHNCAEVFYNPVFKDKLDADPYLIAFKNGVYDLKLNLFRPGRPEDFLSKNMPINYINFSEDDERVQEVHTFFEQVFPDKSVRKYFLDVSSDVFVGGNHEKIVLFWTGDGDNGKSVTQSLFEKMLGKLAIKLNTNIITGKKPSAGSTFAELARAGGGVRWAVMEEPDGDEAINVGIFKSLSGNDSFYARDLFEKGKDTKEITPLMKLVFICLAEGSSVSLPSGISLSIEKLKHNQKLLGYDQDKKGIVNIDQQVLLNKGLQNCITLTLQDGRKITCTPNHKFLSESGEWITAENIVTGETPLKMALDNPKCDDIFTETKYAFSDYNLNDYTDKMKAMALCRLIGYVITDGTLNKTLYIGHKIDAMNICNDIRLISGKTPKIVQNRKVLQIALPEELTRLVTTFTEKQHGGKSSYPAFIFDPECPTYLIREFLGGIFGGDGVVPPILNKRRFGSLQFVASKIAEHVESLVDDFTLISKVMKERFNIDSIVTEPKVYETDKFRVFIRISKHQSVLNFAENIGFRYCCQKMYRMTAISASLRYKNSIVQQNRDIIERAISNYESSGMTKERAFNKAIKETKVIIDKDHLITYKCAVGHYMTSKNKYKTPSINLEKFLESTGLDRFLNQGKGKGKFNYSVDKDSDVLPCYKMIVVSKEECGQKPVYDIVAEEPYSNFIANGIVTHNCNKLPRIKYADKAVWNRVRVIPFESTFCRPESANPAPDSYEEQLRQKRFPMDKQFGKKIPSLLEPLAWVLLQHRQKLTTRVEPEKVRAATEIYRKQNDVYRQFIEETIIEDATKYISLTELYSMFKDWFKDSLPNHTLPNKNEVEEYFVKLWGSTEPGKKWKGYRQRTIQDDVDDGNAVILGEDDLEDYSSETAANPLLR